MTNIDDTISDLIIPKSDQLNAEQLLESKMIIKITHAVKLGKEVKQQRMVIHYENEDGRPYKPCKTALRQIELAWGKDFPISKYPGRSLELFRNPKARFSGKEVGGIRICGASDMGDDVKVKRMVLSEWRGADGKFTYDVRNLGSSAAIDHATALKSCKTMDELAAAWAKIPNEQKPGFIAAKDEVKAAINKPPVAAADAPADDGGWGLE